MNLNISRRECLKAVGGSVLATGVVSAAAEDRVAEAPKVKPKSVAAAAPSPSLLSNPQSGD